MAGTGEATDNKELLRQIRELRSKLDNLISAFNAVQATVNSPARTEFLPYIGTSTDNALARWNGTTGQRVQNSLVTLDDSGNLAIPQGAHDYFLTAAGGNDGTGLHRGPQDALWITHKANRLIIDDLDGKGIDIRHNNSSVHQIDTDPTSVGSGNVLFNVGREDINFRVDSQSGIMLFADAGLHRLGINTNTPGALLDVNGNSILNGTVTVGTSLTLPAGAAINEFSTDGTLGGNSDSAVPTEKAVKTYITSALSTKVSGPASATDNAIARYNGTTGKSIQDSGVTLSDTNVLAGLGGITMSGTTISSFSTSALLGTSNTTFSTQGAIKAYVDNAVSGVGDVSGPASATDNAIARFDGTGGKTIQNSGVVVNDSDEISGVKRLWLGSGSNRIALTHGASTSNIIVVGANTDEVSVQILTNNNLPMIEFRNNTETQTGQLYMDSSGDLYWGATKLN